MKGWHRAAPGEDDDNALFARVRARDIVAFEALYRLYHPRLTRFLTNLVRKPYLVEEVMNDTMLVVWDKPDGFRGDSRLSTWVFAIAYRKAMKAVRRFDEPVEDDDANTRPSVDPGPERGAGDRRTSAALTAALARLSPAHRAVVDLTYFHEMGYREIAEVVDCPVDTVKTRMFHARRNLRTMLAGTFEDWV